MWLWTSMEPYWSASVNVLLGWVLVPTANMCWYVLENMNTVVPAF